MNNDARSVTEITLPLNLYKGDHQSIFISTMLNFLFQVVSGMEGNGIPETWLS